MQPKLKPGLLVESNSIIKDVQLESIIRRDEPITDYYDLEKDCFARGKFAQVRRISHKKSGTLYAAKTIKRRRPRYGDATDEIMHEIRVLMTADPCQFIVGLHEVFETRTEFVLVLELAEGGELHQILEEEECIDERICRRLMRQIVEGIRFLHQNQIAHLDIKPQNILLTRALPDGDVKLCDFGISRKIEDKNEIREIMGTTDYMSPEILQYEPITFSSDIWSIGIVAYVLLSGHSPFGGDDKVHTYSNITSGALEFPEKIFNGVSNEAKDFIQRCLVREPSDRMTCDECLAHEWLMCLTKDDLKICPIGASFMNEVFDSRNNNESQDLDCPSIIISKPIEQSFNSIDSISNGNHNGNCDTCEMNSGQTTTNKNDVGVTTVNDSHQQQYDSDKENSDKKINGNDISTTANKPLPQSSVDSVTPSYKSHKRLSSDIFTNSDQQKLMIAVVANSTTSLKKYTSESAMLNIDMNANETKTNATNSISNRTLFNTSRNDSNNNLMKEKNGNIDVSLVVDGVNNTRCGSNEPSPPSTPNKKLYLSIDDSICHFGSSSADTSKFFTKIISSISPPVSNQSLDNYRTRSISMERLHSCNTVQTSSNGSMLDNVNSDGCEQSSNHHDFNSKIVDHNSHNQLLGTKSSHQYQSMSSSSTTISSSSSSSMSSLIITSNNTDAFFSKHQPHHHQHQQCQTKLTSEVSSPSY